MKIFRHLHRSVQNDTYIPGRYCMLEKQRSESTCNDGDSTTVISDTSEKDGACHRKQQTVTFATLTPSKAFACEWYADDVNSDDIWYTTETIRAFKERTMQTVLTLVVECDEAINQPKECRGGQQEWILSVAGAFSKCQEINTRQSMIALYDSVGQLSKRHSSFDLAQWTVYRVTKTSSSKQRRRLYANIQRLQKSKLATKDEHRLKEEIRHASTQASRCSKLFSGYLGRALHHELTAGDE